MTKLKDCQLVNMRVFLVIFLMLAGTAAITAQVPVNGFCRYQSFDVESNYSALYALNFNADSYNDLILLSGEKKKLLTLSGKANADFNSPLSVTSPVGFTKLSPIYENNNVIAHAFIARMERSAGIVNFGRNGTPRIVSKIKLNSYPENLSLADVNGNGKKEFLISGSSFEGLSVLFPNGNSLSENRVEIKGIFSHSVFADLNNDGRSDIVAFDMLNKNMNFYYNNSRGQFNKTRSIKFNEKIGYLQSLDFNFDRYQDLIFIKGENVYVLFGDSVSSYKTFIKLSPKNAPAKCLIADFNNDGYNDVACIDQKNSTLSIFYFNNGNKHYPEITYLNKNNIVDVIPYYSKFVNGIMALDRSGKLFMINNFTAIQEIANISLGSEPGRIGYFDAGHDKIYDICYYDVMEQALDLVIRNNAGVPTSFFSIPTIKKFDLFEVDDSDPYYKTFYCYSKNDRLIEIVLLDLHNNKINKEYLYSEGPIKDLKCQKLPDGQRPRIYVLSNKDNKLALQIFDYKDIRYNSSNFKNLAFGVFDAFISVEKIFSVYYWQAADKRFNLTQLFFDNNFSPKNYLGRYSFAQQNGTSIVSKLGDISNRDVNSFLSFVSFSDRKLGIIAYEKDTRLIDLDPSMRVYSQDQLAIGEETNSGIKKLFYYDPSQQMLNMLDLLSGGRSLQPALPINIKGINSFFIKSMSFNRNHVVYSDKNEKCITIRTF